GLTIDPANVSNIWIVDSGTDRVYQYTGAASRTFGSQSAAATFALAAGNTNPQGIADPPPLGTMQHDVRPATGSSKSRAFTVSSAEGFDAELLVQLSDQPPVRRSAAVLSR